MRYLKVSVAFILLAAFTLLNASCGFPKVISELTISQNTSESTVFKEFGETDFYVAIGYYDTIDFKMIRLMHFDELSYEYVWWVQDQDQYCVGDVYLLSEESKKQADGLKHVKGPWEQDVYGDYTKFEKIGNCKDLMTVRTLEVTSADLNEQDGWINFKNAAPVPVEEVDIYTFEYGTFDIFEANFQSAQPGDRYTFAFPSKNRMIPLEKVEG